MEAHPAAESWDQFRQSLRSRVTPVTWRTWLEGLSPQSIDAGVVRILAPSEFHLRWVNEKYRPIIEESASAVYGDGVVVEMAASEMPLFDSPTVDDELGPDTLTETPTPVEGEDDPLVPKYSFENFVVGPSNRFAHAAALAIAEQPGGHYNPLFIYGAAGLGKTHLLQAIAQHCADLNPRLEVCYLTSEEFFNGFIDGIRRKRMDEFKARYRSVDMLLLDDVQFLEGKEQILEEFFHTFNSLYEAGKQLVFSSDRPPKSLSSLEDRIRSRFEWGLTTDIQPPDVETRLAILRKNAAFAPVVVPEPVLDFMANRVVDNIRELEGALTRVTAYAALTHQPIDLEMAEDVLQDLGPAHNAMPISPGRILAASSESFGVSIGDLEGPSRKQPLARARQVAMYICRELTDLSLPKIGSLFGGRDHTTVLHGVNNVARLMKEDQQLFDRVTALLQSLRKS
ncbi:MAG: chromosomal replication initiator protein DnaA [Acidimicrobiia bacterium]